MKQIISFTSRRDSNMRGLVRFKHLTAVCPPLSSDAPSPTLDPTQSLWLSKDGGVGATSPRHDLPNHINTVVIGGGMTGTSAAYHLATKGTPVLLLEARGLAGNGMMHSDGGGY